MVNDQSAVNTEAGKKGLAHLKLLQYRQSKCFQEESQLLVIVNTPEIITVTTSLFRKTGAAAAQNVVCMFDMLLSYMFSRCRPCVRACVFLDRSLGLHYQSSSANIRNGAEL